MQLNRKEEVFQDRGGRRGSIRTVPLGLALAWVLAIGVFGGFASGCSGASSRKSQHRLSLATVEHVFRAHHLPVAHPYCRNLPLDSGAAPRTHAAAAGSTCQLVYDSPSRITHHPHHPSTLYHFEILTAVVVRGHLSYSAAQRYAHFGGVGYEHFVVANVVVVVFGQLPTGRLRADDEKRLRAVVADLTHQASST